MLALLITRDGTDEGQDAVDIQVAAEGCMKLFDDLESCIADINIKRQEISLRVIVISG